MKRTHVTIDGITLSRAQVERAVKALEEEEVTFRQGDVVLHKPSGYHMIVIGRGTAAERAFDSYWMNRSAHEYHLIAIAGTYNGTATAGPEYLMLVRAARDLV